MDPWIAMGFCGGEEMVVGSTSLNLTNPSGGALNPKAKVTFSPRSWGGWGNFAVK